MFSDDGRSAAPIQILVVVETPGIRELIELVIYEQDEWVALLVEDTASALNVLLQRRIEALIVEVPFASRLESELMALRGAERDALKSRVILVSAGPAREMQFALDRGLASSIIEMPFDVDDLITTIKTVVDAN